MLNSISRIEQYTRDISEEEFYTNFLIQDAVIRNIQVIGEASKKFEESFKESNLHIPWRKIGAMRNKIIHEYFGIDLPAVWQVVAVDLMILKDQLLDLQNKL
ncbi:MAG: DUF86 domain-containing protein [Cyclobacteriaceae bacterium]|nr:MAG: DUF86 domain-containing protein [Cyclobacteriaceae bacterium]